MPRDAPIHFATGIFFFLSEFEYKYLPSEIFHKTKTCLPIRLLHISRKSDTELFEEKLFIWTVLCRNLNLEMLPVNYFCVVLWLVLFHVVVDGKTGIFFWYKEFQSSRAHGFRDWIIENIQR